jgi:hypothetical protein
MFVAAAALVTMTFYQVLIPKTFEAAAAALVTMTFYQVLIPKMFEAAAAALIPKMFVAAAAALVTMTLFFFLAVVRPYHIEALRHSYQEAEHCS